MIPLQLPIYPGSFVITTSVTVIRTVAMVTNIAAKTGDRKQKPCRLSPERCKNCMRQKFN